MADTTEAHVFAGVQVNNLDETRDLVNQLESKGFRTIDLSDNETAKLHVRHLVGGHAPLEVRQRNALGALGELVYRFEFPERPGALMKVLDAMGSSWNISLFHYRNHGGDYGRVMVGMQVPKKEMPAFRKFLKTLGYPWEDETDNPAYKLFLG
jgi:threonine dehydratase